MSISTELHRITQAKADLKSVIEKRGGTIHENATLDYYPDILDNCTYVREGTFIPEEDTKIFSISGLPFVPNFFSFVCPDECVKNTNNSVIFGVLGTKGFNGTMFYKNSSGATANAFIDTSSTVFQWGTDGVEISIPIAVYFKKGLVYKYVISGDRDPNRHAEYFTITDDGELSLKAEYTASGELNAELPSDLVIPEVVNSINSDRLTEAMLMNNEVIEVLTVPATIDEIPANFCNGAMNLKRLNNTGHLVKVGEKAFLSCKLERVLLPSLEQLGAQAFGRNAHLIYADIGKVSVIEESTFRNDIALTEVESDGTITSIGEGAFGCTWSLKELSLSDALTSIGNYGFLRSALDYDWISLSNCTFGTKATSLQVNLKDFWSNVTPTPRVNPIPTQLCQYDERWVDNVIGQTTYKYKEGCLLFSLIHAYCGLKGLTLSTIFEFEDIVNSINPDLLNGFDKSYQNAANILNGLGLNATLVNEERKPWNESMLSDLYSTLNNGGYALVSVQTELGHAVVVYGVNENGELLFLDSNRFYPYDSSKPAVGKLNVQQLIDSSREFVIVTMD